MVKDRTVDVVLKPASRNTMALALTSSSVIPEQNGQRNRNGCPLIFTCSGLHEVGTTNNYLT